MPQSNNQPHNQTTPEQWEQGFAQVARNSGLRPLPQRVHQNLSAAFATYAAANKPPSIWQQIVAALSFDSQQQLIPAGARAVAGSDTRQLVYATEAGDIALDITTQDDALHVNGQIFADGAALVQLVQFDVEHSAVQTNEYGEFKLAAADGIYNMIVSTATHEIVLNDVPLTL